MPITHAIIRTGAAGVAFYTLGPFEPGTLIKNLIFVAFDQNITLGFSASLASSPGGYINSEFHDSEPVPFMFASANPDGNSRVFGIGVYTTSDRPFFIIRVESPGGGTDDVAASVEVVPPPKEIPKETVSKSGKGQVPKSSRLPKAKKSKLSRGTAAPLAPAVSRFIRG